MSVFGIWLYGWSSWQDMFNDLITIRHRFFINAWLPSRNYWANKSVDTHIRSRNKHKNTIWDSAQMEKLPLDSFTGDSAFFCNSVFSFKMSSWAKRSSYSLIANFSSTASFSSSKLWGSATALRNESSRKQKKH